MSFIIENVIAPQDDDFVYGNIEMNSKRAKGFRSEYTNLHWAAINKIGCHKTECLGPGVSNDYIYFLVCKFYPPAMHAKKPTNMAYPFETGQPNEKCRKDKHLCSNLCPFYNKDTDCGYRLATGSKMTTDFCNRCRATCKCPPDMIFYDNNIFINQLSEGNIIFTKVKYR